MFLSLHPFNEKHSTYDICLVGIANHSEERTPVRAYQKRSERKKHEKEFLEDCGWKGNKYGRDWVEARIETQKNN